MILGKSYFKGRMRVCLILLYFALLFPLIIPGELASGASWGTYLGEYQDVPVYSNGSTRNIRTPIREYGHRYQDTEYVNRFYAKVLKWRNMRGVGSSENYYLAEKLTGLRSYPNGDSVGPQPNDILSFDCGHLAIVTGVRSNSLDVIEQNWSNDNSRRTLKLKIVKGRYEVDSGSSDCEVQGWLRIPPPAKSEPMPEALSPPPNPNLSFTPFSGPSGTKVVVKGWGWEPRQDIYLRYEIGRGPGFPPKREYRHLIADSGGSFVDSYIVPSGFGTGSILGILVEFQNKVPEKKFRITSH